ncbi:hypothetical protein DENSPDRAFT_836975, partial [Dentipellis sp. KUC8613]
MSYHPYVPPQGQQSSPSAHHTMTAPKVQINTESLESLSFAVRSPDAADHDNVVLPSRAQLDKDMYEAKLAWDQGRISGTQYGEILCSRTLMGCVRLNRQMQGLRAAMRGEDTRERMKRDFDMTDLELDEARGKTVRKTKMKMENERRGEQALFRRTVTRGH